MSQSLTAGIRSPIILFAVKKLPTSSPAYRCPRCDGIGKPYYLKRETSAATLNFRCPYCGHAWAAKPDPPKTGA